jgi:hypothetical protein
MNFPASAPPARNNRAREKVFGDGPCLPLDREAKARIIKLAEALKHPTEKGKHYGILTAKFVDVLKALIEEFHNCKTGRCFPSYEKIAEKAHTAVSTVYNAIHALEQAGILTWVNRFVWARERCRDLFGKDKWRWRVVRTSNQYTFIDPITRAAWPPGRVWSWRDWKARLRQNRDQSSNSKFQAETEERKLERKKEISLDAGNQRLDPTKQALLRPESPYRRLVEAALVQSRVESRA